MPSLRLPCLSAAAALLWASAALAQLPSPRLESIFPPGGQAGADLEVALTGGDLTDLTALIFDGPGLAAERIDALKFKVHVAADCPPGWREVRAVGRYGVSTPRDFIVSASPSVLMGVDHHLPEKALPVPAPAIVFGHAESEQRDYLKITLKAGERITLSCAAYALDSPMDPVLTVTDSAGRTVARGDDEHDRDAEVSFAAAHDGDYLVAVYDKLFAGSALHLYRLAVGPAPEPISLRRPAAAVALAGPTATPEQEPNDTAASAQALTLPCVIDGHLDSDWFSFYGEAGHPLWIEVAADRESGASDPDVVIYKVTPDAQGAETSKQVAELDDQPDLPAPPRWPTGSRDPAGKFTPDASALYRLHLLDRFGGKSAYRFSIRAVESDFAVLALPISPATEDRKFFTWQENLRRGGSAEFALGALRRGYDGPITLRAEGLPEGVSASGVIPAGTASGWLVFHCSPEAKNWGGFPRIIAEGGGVSRPVQGLVYRWSLDNPDVQRLDARLCRLAVGVCEEPAPLVVAPAESKPWDATIGGALEIPLKFTHHDAKGDWQITPVALPGLAKFDALKVDGGAAAEGKLVLSFENKNGNTFAPGEYAFYLRASGLAAYKADEKAAPKDLKDVEFSAPITVRLTPPPAAPAAPVAK